MGIRRLDLKNAVPIVGDGAIGHPDIGDGRIIPVLVIDCSSHSALKDAILVHEHTLPGDVDAQWLRPLLDKKNVYLSLEFKKPVETTAIICFDVSTQGGLVDWIMNVHGLYLQPSEFGRRVSEGLDQPKIIVEVPSSADLPGWSKIYLASVEKSYRRSGCSKIDACAAANQHLARLKDLWSKRIPRAKKGFFD